MHDRRFWKRLAAIARRGGRAGLAVLVECRGSAPNRPGARLALPDGGEPFGTVGGGVSEAQLVDRLRNRLREGTAPPEIVRLAHHPGASGGAPSGMICGGEQTFVLCEVSSADLPALARLAEEDDAVLHLGPGGLCAEKQGDGWTFVDASDWRYAEPAGPLDRLYIIGGGHVGLALARVMRGQDFRVVVLDNRPGRVEAGRAEGAETWRCVDYGRIAGEIPGGDRVYACIMTFGHAHDESVLEQLVGKPLRYLGLMGSRRKVAELFARLAGRGVPPARLARVRAPIGLPIGSQSPEEIAVSVAAELIQEKNRRPDSAPMHAPSPAAQSRQAGVPPASGRRPGRMFM